MRIRKNAKLSSLIYSHASTGQRVQTHVCQLNQSPWDVIPFSQEPYPSSSYLQFDGEDSFTGNGSLGDSIGAVESVASMAKPEFMFIDDNDEIDGRKKLVDDNERQKMEAEFGFRSQDKRSWQCKNKTDDVSLLKSCSNSTSPSFKRGDKVPARRGRARAAKKGSSLASNPYEFYYYSGFGPLWGKRRSDRRAGGGDEGKAAAVTDAQAGTIAATTNSHSGSQHNNTLSSSSQFHNDGGFDYVDDEDDEEDENDEDDEEDENGDRGKKRTRKPVKARSLKSLM